MHEALQVVQQGVMVNNKYYYYKRNRNSYKYGRVVSLKTINDSNILRFSFYLFFQVVFALLVLMMILMQCFLPMVQNRHNDWLNLIIVT